MKVDLEEADRVAEIMLSSGRTGGGTIKNLIEYVRELEKEREETAEAHTLALELAESKGCNDARAYGDRAAINLSAQQRVNRQVTRHLSEVAAALANATVEINLALAVKPEKEG